MVGHQIRLRGDDNFSYWLGKKKNKKSSGRVCGRVYFCVKCFKVGLHNAVHELALKQVHQETFYWERKKFHCYNKSVGSNNMFWSNYLFTFVVKRVVPLNICLRQR